MKQEVKMILAGIVGTILLASIVFGSLLPFARSRRFIAALRSFPNIQSVEQFTAVFDSVFGFYAPVGDEEIVKFLSNDIMNVVAQSTVPEGPARMLAEYVDAHLFKDDVRHLLTSGQLSYFLWKRFGKETDFQKAEADFLKAKEIGPKLPPPLFALLSLYRDGNKTEEAKAIAERIVELWPADNATRGWLESLK